MHVHGTEVYIYIIPKRYVILILSDTEISYTFQYFQKNWWKNDLP